MKRLLLLCAMSFCGMFCATYLSSATVTAAVPQRIASLNLCTDQLLLMLVPRGRIVSVSDWAAKPESSYMAAAAQGIPTNHGLAEGALAHDPDLILAGEYTDIAMVNLLRRLGYRVEVVKVPRDLDEMRAHILHVGALVGESAAAQRMLASMEIRMHAIAAHTSTGPRGLAAAYAPNGLTVGRGAVLAQIIERAGWRNLGSELGIAGYGQISLEQLLVAQPQLLVLDVTADSSGGSIAHGYLEHPALRSLAQSARLVIMPPHLSECVGPMTIDAIELLVAQR